MAKKFFIVSAGLILIIACATSAYCDNPVRKLGRGICNAVTFPFEIPLQISRTNNMDGPMAGATYGLLKGIGMAGLRAAVGVYEIVTFPIPTPRSYKPILNDPEFILEEMSW